MSRALESEAVFRARATLARQLERIGYDVSAVQGQGPDEVTTQMQLLYFQQPHLPFCLPPDRFERRLPEDDDEAEPETAHVLWFREAQSLEAMLQRVYPVADQAVHPRDLVVAVVPNEFSDALQTKLREVLISYWVNSQRMVIVHTYGRLGFDCTLHVQVPRHRVLAPAEAAEVCARYRVVRPAEQLPTISRFDPQAKAICARPGDILEIERPGVYYYRYCVNV